MKLKQICSILGLVIISFFTQAKTATNVMVKTELASPIVMADEQKPNYLKIALTGSNLEKQKRVPINLALVIDRSGSMSGDRIEKAKEAAVMAINMLTENDMVSVIAYDSNAEVVIPASKVKDKQKLIKIINSQIHADGMTALFAGLSKGINQVDKFLDKNKVNRVILLSDGQANVGPTSVSELSELAMIAAKKGIAVTTIGIGLGYNESLMSSIASYSDGNHAFVEKSSDLEHVFVREFKDVMSVVAQEVVITITLQDGVKPIRLLGRDGEINGKVVKVKMNQLYSNQEKYVLLELVPQAGKVNEQKNVASVNVSYENLLEKKKEDYQDTVTISFTSKPDVVKKAIVEEVVVESEIQKATIENQKAFELYKQGNVSAAKEMIAENSAKLKAATSSFSSPAASSRALEQVEKNQIMAEEIDSSDKNKFQKKMTEMQFESKQGSINKK